MTREEAIKVLQREKDYVQQAIQKATDGDGYVSPDGLIRADDYVEACTEAISALRQQEQQPNAPLTLDELRKMDGEPVYIPKGECWARVSTANDFTVFVWPDKSSCSAADWYNQGCGQAFRQKPEEGTV